MRTMTSTAIYDAVHSIFQSMLGIEPVLQTIERTDQFVKNAGIAAIVGYGGDHEGTIAFICSRKVAAQLAEAMLMEDGLDPESEEVDDAMGEIANMIAGQLKNLVCQEGDEVQLSIPVIVRGGDYRLQVPNDYERLRMTAHHTNDQPFFVELVSREPIG
jgi:chemotaxis protein CheX